MTEIDKDAQAYWHILRLPADGWGMHCCPKTGQASHWVMLSMWNKHGREAYEAALDRTRPFRRQA